MSNRTESLPRTPEMAIHGLEYAKTITRYSGILESIDVAKIAIERCMIAKKPIPKTYPYMEKGYQYRNTCPSCNENLTKILIYNETTNPNHCPNCGQLIDWSDING